MLQLSLSHEEDPEILQFHLMQDLSTNLKRASLFWLRTMALDLVLIPRHFTLDYKPLEVLA